MNPSSKSTDSVLLNPAEFLSYAMLVNDMAIDTETNAQDIRDGRGFATGISGAIKYHGTYYSAYFPVAHTSDNVDSVTKQLLFDVIRVKDRVFMHNAKFDLVALRTAGFIGKIQRWYCTMLMAHMLNENLPSKSLDWLSKNELKDGGKHKPPEWELMHAVYGWSPDFPAHIMALYAGEDAVKCYKLFERMYPFFVESGFDGSKM